ncbi:MAG: chitinase [Streptosporangiaceae bacterium]|nr:chitinase [Streptosporangiaceae bacterium]
MKRRTPILAALVAASATIIGLTAPNVLAVSGASGAATGNAGAGAAKQFFGGSLPRQVFAPYFEMYNPEAGLTTLSHQSGAKYLVLAFLQTAQPGSCTAYWNGDPTQPISPASYGSDIAAIQAAGGNVVPSFGGYSADTTGTEIADSCTNVPAIAQVYESLITTYNIPRIDLDVEGDSVNNAAGIDRRNKAIALVEAWAKAHHRGIQFSYTLPTFPTGLPPAELSVLQNAVANGAKVSVVNIMTFDYYIGTTQDMLADTESAASALVSQLGSLYPGVPAARLWHMVGVTEMPGIDDFGTAETYTKADAVATLKWALSKGISTLSFWALQRDNGSCPGTKGADSCSGLNQPAWFFSHVFEGFTR